MAKATKQRGMFDKEITDKDVEQSLVDAIETLDSEEYHEIAKARTAAKKLIDETLAGMKLKAGERLRVGPYVIPVVERTGGDFHMKPWRATGPGPIKRVEEHVFPNGSE